MNQAHENKLRQIGSVAYSRFETVCNSFDLACEAIWQKIPGAFVECGVAAGSQIGAMAYACQVLGQNRQLWLFDSFCGIPLAGKNDDQQPGIGKITHDVNVSQDSLLKTTGISSCSVAGVKNNFAKWGLPIGNTVFVEGWFEKTVPGAIVDKIAILRLDGDLYSSTKVCMDNLYHKVVKGGFVIIDDYALAGARKAVDDYLKEHNLTPEMHVVPTTEKVVWWVHE